jgi:hypothetical protein
MQQKWDTANAIKAEAAAQKLLPEALRTPATNRMLRI